MRVSRWRRRGVGVVCEGAAALEGSSGWGLGLFGAVGLWFAMCCCCCWARGWGEGNGARERGVCARWAGD